MDEDRKSRKKLIITSVVILALMAAAAWLLFSKTQYVTVEIYAIPSDTQITIDGKATESETVSIKKGKHTIVGKRQYFGTVTMEYDTDQLTSDKLIIVALRPNSPEGEAYLDEHPEEVLRYERISGIEFNQLQEKLIRQYPLLSELPYRTIDYVISYRVTKEEAVVYTIQLYPVATTPGSDLYKEQVAELETSALAWLKSKGVDRTNSEIEVLVDTETEAETTP